MYNKRRKNDPIIRDGPEWKYVLTREERTKIDISKRLLVALKFYQRTMGIRTVTEAAARAIALGIRDDMRYRSPLLETTRTIERMLKDYIRDHGLNIKPMKGSKRTDIKS